MCGIAGVMHTDGRAPASESIDRLMRALAHRGPDGHGRYLSDDTALVQTRLAIIDLETGDQPLQGPGDTALVANGEIYNYRALRRALGTERFRTRSDCEPPLALYADMAEEGLDRLRGMYALALHDPARGRLVLARDPFGIKPLYYTERADGIAFASEPQALIAAGLASRELATDKVTELVHLQFTTGAETVFRDVRRVLPGETLVVERGRIVSRRRRAALPAGGPIECGETEALEALEAALTDSVRVHLQTDVGYGLFLSGGIDSSVLLALIARETGQPVQTYTAGFPGTSVPDERGAAAALAHRFGTAHREVAFGPDDFWRLLPRVAAAVDDPVADYAILPTFKLAELAASEQKVVLTGEGGDEILAGYHHHRSIARSWWRGVRRRPGYRLFRRMRHMSRIGGLLMDDFVVRGFIAGTEIAARTQGRSRLQAAQAVDCIEYLPHNLLTKVDRCLMAHGLEGRTPYLDPVVADAVFRLPDRFKVRGGVTKWLLRTLLERLAPGAGAFRPKLGFDVPAAEWIRARGPALGHGIAAQPGMREVCKPDVVHAVYESGDDRVGYAAWVLLFYALWHHIHVLGHAPGPSPEETLVQR